MEHSDDRLDQKRMIQDQNNWPFWPLLPMKRSYNNRPNVGVLGYFADEDGKGALWFYPGQNIFTFQPGLENMKILDIDKFLDEGWRVD